MATVTLTPINDVWMRVTTDDATAREIHEHFSFDVPGAKFMPMFRKRRWNGKIHLFKLRERVLYRGLLTRLLSFADMQGYTVENQIPDPNPPTASAVEWTHAHPLPVTPRSYQLDAVNHLLAANRGIVLSPTGSGKSLMIYMLSRMIQQRTLVVVPTTSLVAQMASDFVGYGVDPTHIQTIQGGTPKTPSRPIVVSTWQSIYQQPASWFASFGCVIVDEVHLAKAASLTSIMTHCEAIPYRFGFTGTLDDLQVHRLILEGLFGDVYRVTTTHQLMQDDHLAALDVKLCVLQYPPSDCAAMKGISYQEEVDFLVSHPARLEIVAQMAARVKGNVLVLFNYVEKHGKPLYRRIQDIVVGRDVHFVSGEVPGEERERIRKWVNSATDQIIVASYGTFSTGIDLPNLQTLIFASPSKSKIRVLQSIGRSLRKHSGKSHATLIDLVDDLRSGTTQNHVFRHAQERVKYYTSEQFPFSSLEMNIDSWVGRLRR